MSILNLTFRLVCLVVLLDIHPIVGAVISNDRKGENTDSLIAHPSATQLVSTDRIQSDIEQAREMMDASPDSAMIVINQVLKLLNTADLDEYKGEAYIVKSAIYSYKAQYDSAVHYSYQALIQGEKHQNNQIIFDAYNNLGIDYMYNEDYEQARIYFERAVQKADQMGERYRKGHALNNLGMIAYYQNEIDMELEYYSQALAIFEELNEEEGIGNALLNIGTHFMERQSYLQAESYYLRALKVYDNLGYKSAYGQVLGSMAENYLAQQKYPEALDMAKKAMDIFEDNHTPSELAYSLELLKSIYLEMGDYQGAYSFMARYHSLYEQIFNDEKSKQIANLHLKFETSLKEAEIERLNLEYEMQRVELNHTRIIMLVISVFAVIVLIAAVIIYVLRIKYYKAERLAQESQLEALQTRYIELLNGPNSFKLELDREELNKRLFNPLTSREYEIMDLSLRGKTNQELADQLFISLSTVKFHLGNIYNKLGVSNKKEAMEYVIKTS
ncbi:tetratricopeptide repeat protein [Reichenbachiella agarivorans]|uniref:Tetratricopeptide repeat protein n=1 Tax=Reichenbachiella agarivorans TaxID=2979464 RepID=A0ABY6CME5_9BACT|nr:tetratricopeptide repeat protein [Reichenbachiella agarivorans]UXP31647.1 tetratricopeptide repeat protein [Reichenbachiella agarivorans]